MGDYTESIEIDYDTTIISYEELLQVFWGNHNPLRDTFYKGRQYISLLLYHNEDQKDQAEKIKIEYEQKLNGEIDTEMAVYSTFYLAEDYHQKYYLKRYANVVEQVDHLFLDHKDFVYSTIAARLNGFVAGHGNLVDLKEEMKEWGLNDEESEVLARLVNNIKW